MTTTAVRDISRLTRPECTAIAKAELDRIADLLDDLHDVDWGRPTDCPVWDVRALAGHVLGMAQTFSALARFIPDMRAASTAAKHSEVVFIDALTDLQVRRNAELDRQALIGELRTRAPIQTNWRARRRLMRRIPFKNEMPDGTVETWRAGYLFDVILTRDPWMHRIDLSRAADHDMLLTADHDGRIVADVVAEWAERHGQPFRLTLTGPAGGRWSNGSGGAQFELDAVDFCRTVSGRRTGEGLLTVSVPF
jgi:uncharacterized protein (TIGR03083 family)